ncbi:MAG: hypothetical protein HZB53_18925 [Chloroflexi bacterium]|nr:hypothetical protein [Chloroflexota bacterium]
MKRQWWVALIILAGTAMLAAACGANGPSPTPASTNRPPSPSPSRQTTAPTAHANNATSAPTVSAAADELSLDSRNEGLDGLDSYHIQWEAQWSGVDKGTTVKQSALLVKEYSFGPDQLHLKYVLTDRTAKARTWELWRRGRLAHLSKPDTAGKQVCTSMPADDVIAKAIEGQFGPGMGGGLTGARFVGLDLTNGTPTQHYQYDESSAVLDKVLYVSGKVSGDVWVAVDGGHVMKDSMKWQGSPGLFFGTIDLSQGQGQWSWQLTDVNKQISFSAPPAGC